MLQCFGPAADMVVSSRDRLKDRLMQSQLGSAPLVREGYRNHRLMERPTSVIFESIGEDKPLWLDDLLIYASLSLYDPLVFLCNSITAVWALLREGRTGLGTDGIAIDELRKYPWRSHGYEPASSRSGVSFAGDHGAAVRPPPLHQMLGVGKCLENEFAGGVEDARDDKLTIGWFGALIRFYFFWHIISPSIELCTDQFQSDPPFTSAAQASATNYGDLFKPAAMYSASWSSDDILGFAAFGFEASDLMAARADRNAQPSALYDITRRDFHSSYYVRRAEPTIGWRSGERQRLLSVKLVQVYSMRLAKEP